MFPVIAEPRKRAALSMLKSEGDAQLRTCVLFAQLRVQELPASDGAGLHGARGLEPSRAIRGAPRGRCAYWV